MKTTDVKKMDYSLIFRIIFTTILLFGAYRETGPFTLIILILAMTSIEFIVFYLKIKSKEK